MAQLISVKKHQIKKCDKCGRDITFWQNRNGKWIAVDVLYHPTIGAHYRTQYGNHKNMTMWHDCKHYQDMDKHHRESRREEAVKRAKDAVAAKYLPQMMDLAQRINAALASGTIDKALEAEAEELNGRYIDEADRAAAKALVEFDAPAPLKQSQEIAS